jgi:hypothetical protein
MSKHEYLLEQAKAYIYVCVTSPQHLNHIEGISYRLEHEILRGISIWPLYMTRRTISLPSTIQCLDEVSMFFMDTSSALANATVSDTKVTRSAGVKVLFLRVTSCFMVDHSELV